MVESPESWKSRLTGMERWYQDLAGDPAQAAAALARDYAPYDEILGSMRGHVLDVGGGAGLAATYLTAAQSYLVVDPSESWLDPKWKAIRSSMGGSRIAPEFRTGFGEDLPVASSEFDAVLLMWSLNHVRESEKVMQEVGRVARPGADVLVVLEDVVPTHRDVGMEIIRTAVRRITGMNPAGWPFPDMGESLRTVWRKKYGGEPWPLQDDHLRIDEASFVRSLSPWFRVRRRWWAAGFLSFLLRRR